MRMEFEVLDSTLWPKLKQGSQVEIKITKTGYGFGIIEVRSAEANHEMSAIEPAERAVNQDHHDASRQPEKSLNHLHHGHGEQSDKSIEPSLQDRQEQEDRPMEHAHHDHGGQL